MFPMPKTLRDLVHATNNYPTTWEVATRIEPPPRIPEEEEHPFIHNPYLANPSSMRLQEKYRLLKEGKLQVSAEERLLIEDAVNAIQPLLR